HRVFSSRRRHTGFSRDWSSDVCSSDLGHTVQYGRRDRRTYSRINEVLEVPNLIEIQQQSYQWFLDDGLREMFQDISPIQDFTGKDRKSTRLNSSHVKISYAVFCLKKKK